MLKRKSLAITLFALGSVSAFAQEGKTERSSSEVENSALWSEFIALRPQVGFSNYENGAGQGYTDTTLGVTASMNLLKVSNVFDLSSDKFFLGPESGLFFTHLSPSSSTYLNLPIDVKVGYLITDQLRIGGHTGGNLLYRSTANAMRLSDTAESQNAAINLYYHVGADVDYAFSKNVALSFRPDVTFTPGDNIFAASIAFILPLATG